MAEPETKQLGDRALEMLAAVLLGLATVATAWCAFQASRWNQESTDNARAAAQSKLEASRAFGLATQKISYDATIAALYAQAVAQGNQALQDFYLNNLVRPDFKPVIEQWAASAAAGSSESLNLFENKAYLDAQVADSQVADAAADKSMSKSQDANDNSDGFTRTTIFMAAALFFAGVTGNFRARSVRVILLGMSGLVFAIGLSQIASLAVA